MGFYKCFVLQICICIAFESCVADPIDNHEEEFNIVNVEHVSAITDSTLLLQCPIFGEIEWQLLNDSSNQNGQILLTNSVTFELRSVQLADEGVYACFANKTELVKIYNLTVLEPPHFKRRMQILIVKQAGNTVRLNCKAGGTPTPNITWYKDDKSPPKRALGDIKTNRWSLTLEDSVPNDKGNYTCVVCNIVGCINFTYIVDVIERYHHSPILINGPENSTVPVGSNVTLKCEFLSHLHPHVTWTKSLNKQNDTKVLKRNGNVPELYHIVNVTYQDEGWYACFVSNSAGTTSSKAYLHVIQYLKTEKEEVPNVSSKNSVNSTDQYGENKLLDNNFDNINATSNLTVLEPPHFLQKMRKLVIKAAGNTLKLNCKVGGTPAPNITWYKDDKSPPKRALGDIGIKKWSLTLEDLVPNDKGNYTCVVCNIVGCINFTHIVDVYERFPNPPILTNGLENSTVSVGSNVTLQCKFSSSANSYVTWARFFNKQNDSKVVKESRSGNITDLYQIVNVTRQDEGWYACFISNILGTTSSKAYLHVTEFLETHEGNFANSTDRYGNNKSLDENLENINALTNSTFNLTVLKPPRFLKRMQKLFIKAAGATLKLNCKAEGSPGPNITWYKDDKSPPKRALGDIGINKWSLTLEDLVANDKGNYTCVVCNTVGCINFTHTVDVIEPYFSDPILTINGLQNSTVSVGSDVTLYCKFFSDLLPYVTWTRFLNKQNDSKLLEHNGVAPELYHIANVSHQDEGWYGCSVATGIGMKSSEAYLHVTEKIPNNASTFLEPPRFLKRMRKLVIKNDGDTLKLNCEAEGSPPPNITWYRDYRSPVKRAFGDVKIKRWSLILEDSVPNDTGNYTCVLCNIAGCINFTFVVEVVQPYRTTPVLLRGLKNSTVVVGSNIKLQCEFTPYSYITWTRFSTNRNDSIILRKSNIYNDNPDMYNILNATHKDEGWYACIASNSLGTTSTEAYLQVVGFMEKQDE